MTPDRLTPDRLAELRAAWLSPDEGPRARWRDIRFATTAGLLTSSASGGHLARVVQLLTGTLPDDVAPCLPRGERREPEPVSRARVDWAEVEPREWTAMRRIGLPLDVQRALLAPPEPQQRPATDDARARVRALVSELCGALGAPAHDLGERVRLVTLAVQEERVAWAMEAHGGDRTAAARDLGVDRTRVAQLLDAHPHLAERWPARRGRPRRDDE